MNALRAFEIASRQLSFSKAAVELNDTPAAISQPMRAPEDFVGTPLFYRRARGLALTPAAEAGLPMSLDAFERLHTSVQHIRGETQRSTLTVWTAPSFAARRLIIPFEYSVPLSNAYYLISLEDSRNAGNIDTFRVWLLSEIDAEGSLDRQPRHRKVS